MSPRFWVGWLVLALVVFAIVLPLWWLAIPAALIGGWVFVVVPVCSR